MKPRKPPVYSLHKSTGQAYIRVGETFHYLGRYGSPESHSKYQQAVAEWHASGGLIRSRNKEETTVAEVVAAFLHRSYEFNYAPDALCRVERAMAGLLLFHDCKAHEFGPLRLRAVRDGWIHAGLSRGYINALVGYCKRAFRHAVSMELCGPGIADALNTVENLKKGRSIAIEPDERQPVSWADVEATLPQLTPVTRAMILFMWYTGARGCEVRALRPCYVDTSSKVWLYTVPDEANKGAHLGYARTIYIGPQAQEVLAPWLRRAPSRFCFCPEESRRYKELAKKLAVEAISVLPCGQHPFQRQSFIRAVGRAATAAGVEHWTPHQLRHSASMRLTTIHGTETAQSILGHRSIDMTAHYAKKERERALAAALVSS